MIRTRKWLFLCVCVLMAVDWCIDSGMLNWLQWTLLILLRMVGGQQEVKGVDFNPPHWSLLPVIDQDRETLPCYHATMCRYHVPLLCAVATLTWKLFPSCRCYFLPYSDTIRLYLPLFPPLSVIFCLP